MAWKVRRIRREEKDVGVVAVLATAAPDIETRVAQISTPLALEKMQQEWVVAEFHLRMGLTRELSETGLAQA
jgi:hypothetical protein